MCDICKYMIHMYMYLYDRTAKPIYRLGPLLSHQRNAIQMTFTGGPIVAAYTCRCLLRWCDYMYKMLEFSIPIEAYKPLVTMEFPTLFNCPWSLSVVGCFFFFFFFQLLKF